MSEDSFIRLVQAFQRAMEDERIPDDIARRVVNRVIYGHPRGSHTRIQIQQQPDPGRPLHMAEAARQIIQHQARH